MTKMPAHVAAFAKATGEAVEPLDGSWWLVVPAADSPEMLAALIGGLMEQEYDIVFSAGEFEGLGKGCRILSTAQVEAGEFGRQCHGPTPVAALCTALKAAREASNG